MSHVVVDGQDFLEAAKEKLALDAVGVCRSHCFVRVVACRLKDDIGKGGCTLNRSCRWWVGRLKNDPVVCTDEFGKNDLGPVSNSVELLSPLFGCFVGLALRRTVGIGQNNGYLGNGIQGRTARGVQPFETYLPLLIS